MLAKSKPRLLAGTPPPAGAYDADIIILTLGRLEDSHVAIASALAQKGGVFHVSVLDQGSDPKMLAALTTSFGRVSRFALYGAAENGGVAAGRNVLAHLGHGKIIVGLDNDARFVGLYEVANAARQFDKTPDLGAIGFCILAADGQTLDVSSWGYPKPLRARFQDRFWVTTFVGAGHAIRRAAWEAVGGYDSRFFFCWEEYDFCRAAIARGWRVLYDGQIKIIHNQADEGRVRWQGTRMTYFIRNRLVVGRKWSQGRISLLPRCLAYMLLAMRHHCVRQGWMGIRQGLLAPVEAPRPMPPAMRHYIQIYETKPRGSWLARLWREVFTHRLS